MLLYAIEGKLWEECAAGFIRNTGKQHVRLEFVFVVNFSSLDATIKSKTEVFGGIDFLSAVF